ncbi:helix-turn-helix domain-containing protein [Streptomyces spinoverrucosus]|uniref:helix-turn-helix domain-containing protein n=1 Tax=Streptomyces spinoverrucosus TaxID=284043 RepID=UPI0018C3A040|nr:helix-turn-helix transcriptional regulator [Streptomyces spinoverrucosus]MBG0854781.1 helix-turn-helix domain-containing protein [Streptomyces spinoverrucosus]
MTFEPEQLGQSRTDLAEKLRELRKRAGFTGDRLARRCNMSQSQISKFETGKKTPKIVDVERILQALDAPPQIVAEITALARLVNTEWQDKRSSWRRGMEKRQAELASLESEATELRYFLPSMITGLLATPEFIRASLSHTPGDPSKTVARKLERQAVLYDTSKSFTFLITEQAARWAIVPAPAMAMQIDRLISLSRLPNLRIGVIPTGTVMSRGPMNTFTVYDGRLATVENFTGRMVFRDARDVSEHLAVFSLFEGHAHFDEEARMLLQQWAEAYR